MGFWEGETFWKMCSCDSSRGQHIWAKRSYRVGGGRRSSSLNWEHTCLQSSMSGTPTLFLKDRVLCRCRNSEEAKQKRMEKGSCDDLTLWTPSAVSLPVPHQLGSRSSLLAAAKRTKPVSSDPLPARLSSVFFLQQPPPASICFPASIFSSLLPPAATSPAAAAAAKRKESRRHDLPIPPCAAPALREEEAGIGGTERACGRTEGLKKRRFLAGDVQVNSGTLP